MEEETEKITYWYQVNDWLQIYRTESGRIVYVYNIGLANKKAKSNFKVRDWRNGVQLNTLGIAMGYFIRQKIEYVENQFKNS